MHTLKQLEIKKSTTTCDFQFKIRYLFYAQFEDFPCCIKFKFYSGQSECDLCASSENEIMI